MAIKINFDAAHNPEKPTLVLATRSGLKLNGLDAKHISIKDCQNDAAEITFEVKKYIDGKKNELWDKIKDFKLVWCKEWDVWFECKVDIEESTETTKTISCVRLGVAELSQIMLYDIHINTEEDIERDDYVPTVLFNSLKPEGSLLHRLLSDKAEHYKVIYVDPTIASIQRTFEFDNVSIYDAFQEISEEIGCLFVFHSNSDENGNIQRTISVYDILSNCADCGYRGEFTDRCPECGSTNISEGYGEDTTIFITSEELGNDISFSSDTDSIKNCFKLEGGDDLMTATIRNCNPNGTDYIWYITDAVKEDMSKELVDKLDAYDKLYEYYQKEYIANLDTALLSQYNALVEKYQVYNGALEKINSPVKGYPSLMTAYYNTVDLATYLQTTMMPDASMDDTDAAKEAKLLTRENLSPVAVTNLSIISSATADSAVLSMAKVVVDSRYQVKINRSSLVGTTWTGDFTVTNYSDSEDTATSATVSLEISDNYKLFIEQKIEKALAKEKVNNVSIVGLFELSYTEFCNEIKKYALSSLTRFIDCCQACLDILIEQGVGNAQTWSGQDPNLYNDLYVPYYNKLQALQTEAGVRQKEIDIIVGIYDVDNNLITDGLQTYIGNIKNQIQSALDFEKYLGEDLWLEFCTYRREDKYSNKNYISDGLNNAELFERALEFIQVANDEIYKSAELQHSISTSLKNLLLIEKFKPLVEHFAVGNWLRIQVDDKVYKLRLLEYEIDYDNIEKISVNFSDVLKTATGLSDTTSVLSQAKSMATSYSSTQRQASKGAKGNVTVKDWLNNGLDATNVKIIGGADNQTQTWDSHGMLFRKYDAISDTYDDIQLKIINSTISITDDNWKTVKTAVGSYYYIDPTTKELRHGYGVNAEVLIGRLILGESLGIYSENNSLTFDKNGLQVTNGMNTFTVNPNHEQLLRLSNKDGNILWVDEHGKLYIKGDGAGIDISANETTTALSSRITANAESITAEVKNREKAVGDLETSLSSKITQTATDITAEVTKEVERAGKAEEALSSRITANAESITAEVKNREGAISSITTTINGISTEVSKKVGTNEIISRINQSAEGITISADKISIIGASKIDLRGYVTAAGGKFSVGTDGAITATDGTFTGSIIATSFMVNQMILFYNRSVSQHASCISSNGAKMVIGADSGGNQVGNGLESYGAFVNYGNITASNGTVSGTTLYEGGTALANKYAASGHSHSIPVQNQIKTIEGNTRYPVGCSENVSNKVAQVAARESTFAIRGTWGAGGSSYTNRAISCPSSDIRLKENIKDTEIKALPVLCNIKMRQFDWKDREENRHQKLGFVADELESIDQKFAIGGGFDEDGIMDVKSVDTFYLLGYVVKGIQELYDEINQLQKELATLRKG